MATRLGGPVEIEVRLNTKKAEGQIDKLSESLKKGQKQAENLARTERAHKAIGIGGPGRGAGVGREQGDTGRSITETLLSRAKATSLRGNVVSSAVGQRLAGAGQFLSPGAMGVAKGVGAAALGYAAVSAAAQAAPTASYAVTKAIDPNADAGPLQDMLEQFRRLFSTFESGVTSLKPSADQSWAYMKAALRLGADVPNMGESFNQNFMANVMQSEIDKKFEAFKSKEFYARGGEVMRKKLEEAIDSFGKAFKGSMSQ